MFFQRIADFLAQTFNGVPWSIFWLVFLAIAIAITLIVILLKNKPENGTPIEDQENSSFFRRIWDFITRRKKIINTIHESFHQTKLFLLRAFGGHDYAYKLPWFLLMGHEESGKSTLMDQKTFSFAAFGDKDHECQWHFLRRGIVLDVRGDLFVSKEGVDSEEDSWLSMLLCLCKYRPKQPINGIIFTISVTELDTHDSFMERVRFMSQKIMNMQDTLGLCLPVYVVITKMDLIQGFSSFCQETSVENQQNIFGWSNPYSLSLSYSPRLIDEAFEKISEELFNLEFSMLSRAHIEKTRDGIVMLNHEIEKLKKPISIVLNALFQNASYEEMPIFRGLYFVGEGIESQNVLRAENESLSESHSLVVHHPHKIFFVEDLLEKKILCEVGLSRPLKRHISRVRKSLFIAKLTTLILVSGGSYGAFVAYDRFKHISKELMPLFLRINKSFKETMNHSKTDEDHFTHYTQELVHTISKIEDCSFVSLFIPASWFSPVKKEMFHVLKESYQGIVLKGIYMDLLFKIRHLIQDEVPQGSFVFSLDPLKAPSFHNLVTFIDELELLDLAIKKFNQLRSTGNLADLNDLSRYVFGATLPVSMWTQQTRLISFLQSMPFPNIDIVPYSKIAQEKCIKYFQTFLTTALKNCFTDQIYHFFQFLNNRDMENIRKFSIIFSQTPTIESGTFWVDLDFFSPGKAYNDIFTKIDNFHLFGKSFTQNLLSLASQEFQKFQKTMKAINRQIYPPHAMEDHPLSEGLSDIQRSLKLLFQEPYMTIPEQNVFQSKLPEQHIVVWDRYLLQTACSMIEQFKTFMDKQAPYVPHILRNHFHVFALEGLKLHIQNLLGRAQSFIPIEQDNESLEAEEALRSQIRDFREGAPTFFKLLEVLSQGPFATPFMELRDLLAEAALTLLKKVDYLFENLNSYQTVSLNGWMGEKGLALTAFGVRDEEDLVRYLELNRTQIVNLGLEYAKPLVAFLTNRHMLDFEGPRELLNKWHRIVEQVELHHKKAPASSLSRLEKFIRQDFNVYTIESALENIHDVSGESGDFFLEQIRRIKKSVVERARFLRREKSIKAYSELADFFNKFLKNRFPFVGRYVDTTTPEAEPEVIREFFKKFKEAGNSAQNILLEAQDHQEASIFLENMEKVRQFFDNFIADEDDRPYYDLQFDFRINRNHEQGGKNIMYWEAQIDETAPITKHDEKKTQRWIFGNTLSFKFIWPRESELPQQEGRNPSYKAIDNAAIFSYKTRWSLLWLLINHEASKGEYDTTRKDKDFYTLRFEIPTQNGKRVIVYNKLTIKQPSSNSKTAGKALRVPVFPVYAPIM